MIKFIVSLWPVGVIFCITYIYRIVFQIKKTRDTSFAIDLLQAYLQSADFQHGKIRCEHEDYQSNLDQVLRYYPAIRELSGNYDDAMRYGASENENYISAIRLNNDLLMKRNHRIYDLAKCFNPFSALKSIILFPTTVLQWIGFFPNKYPSLFINLVGWTTSYFLEMFQPEIKAWLLGMF